MCDLVCRYALTSTTHKEERAAFDNFFLRWQLSRGQQKTRDGHLINDHDYRPRVYPSASVFVSDVYTLISEDGHTRSDISMQNLHHGIGKLTMAPFTLCPM